MKFHEYLDAIKALPGFTVAHSTYDSVIGRELRVTLRTAKVLKVTHFKALCKLGSYDTFSQAFRFTVKTEWRSDSEMSKEALRALQVITKAAASEATTPEALAERRAALKAKRVRRISEEEVREYADQRWEDTSPAALVLARSALVQFETERIKAVKAAAQA